MRKIALALSAACLLFSLNSTVVARASAPTPLYTGTTAAILAEQAPIHWVSVAQIENSLTGRPPMVVGFDIDDTVLFSSPGFWRGKITYSPDSEAYLKNPEFWENMNNGWDDFSIPKEVARALIAMHVKRGDSIYFVTGRSQTKTETVSKTLQDDFLIPAASMNPVIFAGDQKGKTPKPSGWKRKISRCSTVIQITTSPRRTMWEPEASGCYAPRTPPTGRCQWPENLVKR